MRNANRHYPSSAAPAPLNMPEAWIAPTFVNSWVNHNTSTHYAAKYMKDTQGFVHIRGVVKDGTGGSVIFTLPTGYRPTREMAFSTVANGSPSGVVVVQTDGDVINFAGGNAGFGLDGIHFDTRA